MRLIFTIGRLQHQIGVASHGIVGVENDLGGHVDGCGDMVYRDNVLLRKVMQQGLCDVLRLA